MATTDFTFTILTGQSPEYVFNAIRDVRSWWSGLYNESFSGETKELNDEFSFRAGDGAHYSRQKLVEVVPNKKVVWLITESELSFLEQKDEWVGTKVIFDISEKDGKTELVFTHQGLTPEIECYDSCAPAWSMYLEDKLTPLLK
ncbi:SRPBCC domain-containing protein [Fluviicola sp.]|uniref:SRPBCC family protein n=1 Tax=Fluviicola sp. TaxID=1917219 RepID=UPI0031E36949